MTTYLITLAGLWTCLAISAFVAGYNMILRRRMRLALRRLDAIGAQAAADRAFALWAGRTMLCVTDRTGGVHAWSLRQLHTERVWNMQWASVETTVWHGDPDLLDRYEAELQDHDG